MKTRISFDSRSAEAAQARLCEHPGCMRAGEHRAPKSRDELDAYRWFCLDHVRDYNKTWNYFEGMSRDQIEAFQASVCTWHRETWRPFTTFQFDADFEIVDGLGPIFRGRGRRKRSESRPRPKDRREQALDTLDLKESPITLHKIKRRYKELAKRLHPDVNGDDPKAEERLKEVNLAYDFLLTCGYT